MRSTTRSLMLASLVVLSASQAYSDDTRPNPFKAPPTAQEQQLIQDERTRNVVRSMQGDIADRVALRFERKIDSMEQGLKQKVDEAVKGAQIEAANASSNSTDTTKTASANSLLPEGATFIACVNKKALYRDKDNSLFQDSSDKNRCVNP